MEATIKWSSYKSLLLLLLLFPSFFSVDAQLNYTFSLPTAASTPAANTLAYNAGASIIGASVDDATSAAQNIGFTFTYDCVDYTQFMASSNGWMVLGTGMTGSGVSNALATTGQGPILAPLWDDMKTSSSGNVNYKLTGSAPNRILTIEWLKILWNYNASGPVMTYQVKLYETSNIIDFVYFRESTTINSGSASIGINGGTSATDFYSVDATPAVAYGTETSITTQRPTNRTYRWTPNSMSYVSSNTTQTNTSVVSKCNATDQLIVGVEVVVSGNCSPFSVTQFQLNMTGSTLPGVTTDATKIHIYYTGANSGFAPLNEFLAGGTVPAAGNFTVSGSQQLVAGTNYFWITYDINTATAINADVLDAQCLSVTMSGGVGAKTPTTTSPAGTRAIAACPVAPGGISGMSFWVKGNAGTSTTTDNTALSTWSDQSGNTRHATQGTAANQPKFYDNATNNTNFNPVVDFDDASQVAANGDYMDITANGILSTGANPYTVYAVIKPGGNNLSTPGKYLFAGSAGANNFNSFDVRSGNSLNDSWDLNDLIVGSQWATNYPSLATYDYNTAQREMFVSGASVGTKNTINRTSPNSNNALGCQRSISPMIEFYDGSIAEIVTYANYSHNATQHYQVESYLAIKYGITLQHDYLSSAGATVWNRSLNAAYNTNVIGIARDDNSALSQKQSKSTSTVQDMLTMYIGAAKTTNQASNTGSFTAGNQSFFMAGNNSAAYMYTFPTIPTEKPAGICCRLQREWMVQKTNFTNTDIKLEFDFNVITPGYSPLNTADLRLLVDNDGDFTNATILTPTISVSGSRVTVTVPASSFSATSYFTLASVSTATALPVIISGFTGICKNNTVQLGWAKESGPDNSFVVERSSDGNNFTAIGTLQSAASASQSYTWSDVTPLPGISYYRLKMVGADGTINYSAASSINGCTHTDLQLITDGANGQSTLLMQLPQNAVTDISFCDMLGRRYDIINLTGHRSLQQGYYRLPVADSHLPRGVYVLTVGINGNRSVFRIVKR